jgi:flagellar motility protein MotE (MotC chaperone)
MSTAVEKFVPSQPDYISEITTEKIATTYQLKEQENWAIAQFQKAKHESDKTNKNVKVLEHEHALLKEQFKMQRDVDRVQNERLTRIVRWVGFLIFWNLMGLAFSICMVIAYLIRG